MVREAQGRSLIEVTEEEIGRFGQGEKVGWIGPRGVNRNLYMGLKSPYEEKWVMKQSLGDLKLEAEKAP